MYGTVRTPSQDGRDAEVGADGRQQRGNRGRAHRGGRRHGRFPRLSGVRDGPARDGDAAHASAAPAAVAAKKAPRDKKNPAALPTESGSGERVVYSVDDDRVWLVAENNKVTRTFKVTPGTVDPPTGTYPVTSRSNAILGTDGTPHPARSPLHQRRGRRHRLQRAGKRRNGTARPHDEVRRHPRVDRRRRGHVGIRNDRPEHRGNPLDESNTPQATHPGARGTARQAPTDRQATDYAASR